MQRKPKMKTKLTLISSTSVSHRFGPHWTMAVEDFVFATLSFALYWLAAGSSAMKGKT